MPVKAESNPMLPGLSPVSGRAIVARFDAACMSSDGGLLVLREVDRHLGLAPRLAACIPDPRASNRVVHGLDEIIRARMLMIAASAPGVRSPLTQGRGSKPLCAGLERSPAMSPLTQGRGSKHVGDAPL